MRNYRKCNIELTCNRQMQDSNYKPYVRFCAPEKLQDSACKLCLCSILFTHKTANFGLQNVVHHQVLKHTHAEKHKILITNPMLDSLHLENCKIHVAHPAIV